jgi:hypothetical protein
MSKNSKSPVVARVFMINCDDAAVEAVFNAYRVEVERAEAAQIRAFSGYAPWLIEIVLDGLIFEFIKFVALRSADGLKRLVTELEEHSGTAGPPGSIRVVDSEATAVHLPEGIPSDALTVLEGLDWDELRAGDLHWHPDRGEWSARPTPGIKDV